MGKPRQDQDPVLAELIAIKRLMIFSLQQGGASQAEIGAALGMNQSQVSKMLSGKKS